MSQEKVYTITLKLNSKEELFKKPEITPFSDGYLINSYTSTIEFIAGELYANTSYQRVDATFIVPPAEMADGLEQEIKLAVKRYCRGRLKDIEHNIQAIHWRGKRALIASFFVLFVLMGASILINDQTSVIRQIISIGIAIGGWVAMWIPLESLTFHVWQHRLDKKIYTMLMEMDVTIKAES